MLVAVSTVFGLSITGCAVGPDNRKPAITLEAFHSSAAVGARRTSTSAPALDRWWLGFDADRQLLAAQDQLALTRANSDEAAVQSLRAIGGGWGS